MARDTSDSYAVDLERRWPWLWAARVQLIRDGDAVPLVTVRGLTRRGARRRAARVISVRGDLAEPAPATGRRS